MPVDLAKMIQAQLDLQVNSMGGDPRDLSGEARADFIRWNAYALEDEIHEATAETGWKPWATSRHLNFEAYMKELVDGWHFFMNLLLAGASETDMDPEEIAEYFAELYYAKNKKNAERQEQGYDGVSDKCTYCHRELPADPYTCSAPGCVARGIFCSAEHHMEHQQTLKETS